MNEDRATKPNPKNSGTESRGDTHRDLEEQVGHPIAKGQVVYDISRDRRFTR